jgi:hypothetical protein
MPYLAFSFTISTFEMLAIYISIVLVPFHIGVKKIKGEETNLFIELSLSWPKLYL